VTTSAAAMLSGSWTSSVEGVRRGKQRTVTGRLPRTLRTAGEQCRRR
jgi:hypothetical protein